MKKITFFIIVLFAFAFSWQSNAQFGCGSAVVISDGYTANAITTPGSGGAEDWNDNPSGTSINSSYWDDDVYLFEYTAGASPEIISMTIFSRNSWNGIGIFDDCSGTTFSNELDASGNTSSNTSKTVTSEIAAGNTIYIAVGQWGTPNDLDFDVTNFSVSVISCATPSLVTFDSALSTSAVFSWSDTGASGGYQWVVLADGGDPDLDSPIDSNMESAGSSTATASGLSASTDYDFYIRSDCGVDGASDWVGPISFTTACVAVTAYPYNTDFASCPPNACWLEAGSGDPIAGPGDLGTGLWTDGSYTDGVTYDMNYINLYITNREDWLISESYDLSVGGPYELNYHVRHGNTTAMTSSEPFGSDDYVQLLISTDNGSSWTVVETWDTGNDPDYTGMDYNVDLSAQTGTVQFAFYGTDGSVDDTEDTYFGVSKFEIREIPNCPDVTNIMVSGVSSSSAIISWTAGGSETDWEYAIQVAGTGTPSGSGTPVSGTPSVEDTSLMSATDYEVFVRSYCGGSDYGAWIGPVNFTTSCIAVDSFSEIFDSVSTPDLPTCWSYVIDNGASTFATVGTSTTYSNSSPNSVNLYNSSSSASSNIILVSPVVSNLADGTHQLRFFARNTTSSQDIEVGTISDPNDGSTFTALETVDITTTFTEYTVSFSSYSGSDNYIAIRRLSTSTYTNVYLDDIVWEVAPTDTLDFYNLQWPANGTINAGQSFDVYAKAYEAGLTDVTSGQAPGILCWIGYNTSDTDPSGVDWTWIPATFNVEAGNDDEYTLDLGSSVGMTGTFYYASRWTLNGGPYTYGGIQSDGSYGGQWGVDNNGSGVLIINPAANDLPSGAITLTLDEGTSCGANTIIGISNVGTNDSGEGDPSCLSQWNPSAGNGDLWYSFVAPSSELTLNVTNISGLTSVSGVLYSGVPGSLVEVGTCGNSWPKSYTSLTPSETYYLRLWDYGNDQIGTFDLCGYYLSCTSATVSYSIVNDCDISGGFYIDVDVTDLGSASSLDVDDDQGSSTQQANTTTTLTFGPYVNGTDVVITITPNDNLACLLTSSTLTQAACPPANDDCSNAIVLTPGVVYGDYPLDGTVLGATSDAETNGCGLNGPGVWYSVVVPNDGNITIETGSDAGTGNTAFDSVIEAFSGSCGALVSIECDDDDADTGNYSLLELTGLVPGETIYLRVWEYNGDEAEPFSISAYSGTLSFGNSNSESLFSYYPNPVNNSLTLNAQKTIENVSVVNMLGQEVMNVSPNSINDELDMSNLSNGSYFVRVTVEGITETVRIVKQ